MKLTNIQAANVTLTTGSNTVYLPKNGDAQIRALTVHNVSTALAVPLKISVNGKLIVVKNVAMGTTEVISAMFNQQLKKDEPITMEGTGLNVLMTVVEILE